jgi:hypothetical protein
MSAKVLSIPTAQFAKLFVDPTLHNIFVSNETALVTVWNQQAIKMALVKRAQLLGRITAARARDYVDHLAGLENEIPGVECLLMCRFFERTGILISAQSPDRLPL